MWRGWMLWPANRFAVIGRLSLTWLIRHRKMDAEFSIAVDPTRDLLRITMGGFFSEADIGAFRFALETKMEALTCDANDHLTLCDVSAMSIQAQEIVAAFSKVVGHPTFRSKRLAFVTGSSLARMQTRRLTSRAGVEFFNDRSAAEAWLLD